jgi:hypothetical protein
MNLTVSQVYSVRFGNKLPLPQIVQDNIAKLRITAASYRPVRPPSKFHKPHAKHVDPPFENWRMKTIATYVSKLKDKDDPDYQSICAILNKVSKTTVDPLCKEANEIIVKRDHEFRLRVATLLFNKAITELMFTGLMADCAVKFIQESPELREDILVQVNMFTKLYDINTTLTFPATDDPQHEEKVVQWMKQKDKRRGYAKFLTYLYGHNLVSEDLMMSSLEQVIGELKIVSKQPKTPQTEENTNQFVDFIFETATVLSSKGEKAKKVIRDVLEELLAIPRSELPSLILRSRFRLEDALKCVQ